MPRRRKRATIPRPCSTCSVICSPDASPPCAHALTARKQVPRLVEIRNLQKTFQHMGKELTVLRGIDLDLDEGEVAAIVGQSGAGKSTLLHILGTLDLPTAGYVKINGTDITKISSGALADLRNTMVGFVF